MLAVDLVPPPTLAKSASVGVALIGVGNWGEKIAQSLSRVERVQLAEICDVSAAARARAAVLAPGARVVCDLDDVLGRQEARAVIIATPPATHAGLALRALESGRDVLVEKPMALSLEEARTLERAARETGSLLMVGHILEYHPAIVELRRRIALGQLGELRLIVSERLGSSPRRHENAWWSLAPHDLSVVRLLASAAPTEVRVAGWNNAGDAGADVVAARVSVGAKPCAVLHLSLVDREKVRQLVVVGSEGVAVFDDLSPERMLRFYSAAELGRGRIDELVGKASEFDPARQSRFDVLDGVRPGRFLPTGPGLVVPLDRRPPLELEAEHFVRSVLDGTPVQSDAASGRAVVAVLEAGQSSLGAESEPREVATE